MLEVTMIEPRPWNPYRTVMVVKHNGKIIAEESDGGEPEDNLFCKDWSFVPGLVEEVYKLGVKDGRELRICEKHGIKGDYE